MKTTSTWDRIRDRIRPLARSWHVYGWYLTVSPLNLVINQERGFPLKLVLVCVIIVVTRSSSLSSFVSVFDCSAWKCLVAVVTVVAELPASAATVAQGESRTFFFFLGKWRFSRKIFFLDFFNWVFGYPFGWIAWKNCLFIYFPLRGYSDQLNLNLCFPLSEHASPFSLWFCFLGVLVGFLGTLFGESLKKYCFLVFLMSL